MKKLLIIIFLVPILGSSQGRHHVDETVSPDNSILTYYKSSMEIFNGNIIYDTFLNGELYYEINYKDGKKDGLYRRWHKNGQLSIKKNYKDGIEEKLTESWYKNGHLKSQINYKNGRIEGLVKHWTLSTDLIIEENYKDGELDGLSKSYFICSYSCSRGNHQRSYDRYRQNAESIQTFHLTPLWKQLRTKLIKTERNYKRGELVGIQKIWRVGELDTIDSEKRTSRQLDYDRNNDMEESAEAWTHSDNQENTILNKETPEYRHYLYQEENYGETGSLLWSKIYYVNGQKAEVHYSKEYNGVVSDTSFNKDGSILLLDSNKTVEPVVNETTEVNTNKEDDNSNPYLLYILIAIILIITFFFLKNKLLK